jgi:hypothetical protein
VPVEVEPVEFEKDEAVVEQVGKVEEVKDEQPKYTKKQLEHMKLKDMKSIIEKMGIPTPAYNRESYVKAILEAQDK